MFPYYIVRFKRNHDKSKHEPPRKFPYYIVRFKLGRVVSMEVSPYQFPYYIVRFKQKKKLTKKNWASKFPYYIVRFKLMWLAQMRFSHRSFHTTQYDLNFICFFRRVLKKKSFHTTQYDLNFIEKPQVLRRVFLFPYYIVRFKLKWLFHSFSFLMRFHTTQYDLNKNNRTTQCKMEKKFPYYIVRFKRIPVTIRVHGLCIVSILHSTI